MPFPLSEQATLLVDNKKLELFKDEVRNKVSNLFYKAGIYMFRINDKIIIKLY